MIQYLNELIFFENYGVYFLEFKENGRLIIKGNFMDRNNAVLKKSYLFAIRVVKC